jgi:hypothetical protein
MQININLWALFATISSAVSDVLCPQDAGFFVGCNVRFVAARGLITLHRPARPPVRRILATLGGCPTGRLHDTDINPRANAPAATSEHDW